MNENPFNRSLHPLVEFELTSGFRCHQGRLVSPQNLLYWCLDSNFFNDRIPRLQFGENFAEAIEGDFEVVDDLQAGDREVYSILNNIKKTCNGIAARLQPHCSPVVNPLQFQSASLRLPVTP